MSTGNETGESAGIFSVGSKESGERILAGFSAAGSCAGFPWRARPGGAAGSLCASSAGGSAGGDAHNTAMPVLAPGHQDVCEGAQRGEDLPGLLHDMDLRLAA